MKVTSKGQVTIPISVRERFGLAPGTEVEFVATGGVVQIRARRRDGELKPFERWLAKAGGVAQGGPTTAEIMAMTRGED